MRCRPMPSRRRATPSGSRVLCDRPGRSMHSPAATTPDSAAATVSAQGAAQSAGMPAIGLGTGMLGGTSEPRDHAEIVATALCAGYRHIDTARKYGSERGVGEGIRSAGVAREKIFVTTKVSHEYLRADDFARSLDGSLRD